MNLTASNPELFMFPGACSRVVMTAFEEAGLPFREHMVNLGRMEQKSPEYLALNPKGKVPALRVGDKVMSEAAAILVRLDRENPAANLLPHDADEMFDDQGAIDLIWCSGTLHPMVRQIRAPQRYTKGDTSGIHADGMDKFARECQLLSERLAGGRWWYGDRWSVDASYLNWLYTTAAKGGFPLNDYPVLLDHAARTAARPSYRRAVEREAAVAEQHKADLPDGFVL